MSKSQIPNDGYVHWYLQCRCSILHPTDSGGKFASSHPILRLSPIQPRWEASMTRWFSLLASSCTAPHHPRIYRPQVDLARQVAPPSGRALSRVSCELHSHIPQQLPEIAQSGNHLMTLYVLVVHHCTPGDRLTSTFPFQTDWEERRTLEV